MPRVPAVAAALLTVVFAAGCGSSDDSKTPPAQPAPTAKAEDFPAVAKADRLTEIASRYKEGPALASSVSVLGVGENRVGFALFDVARKSLAGAGVALYVSREDGTDVQGPFVARSESLAVKPQFESKTTALDPDAARDVYVADVRFPAKGKWVAVGLAKLDGRIVATSPAELTVGAKGAQPPQVGQKAPRIHTPTIASVGGDASKIDTRVPPAEDLLKTDLYDVLGKKPVVLTFATPQLCQSKVCGPVVDIVQQVKASTSGDVAFIHNEIYRDNDVSKGFRPQVADYKLPTEPWTFVIDRSGRVSARFEGAFSPGELQRAVAKVEAAKG